MADVATLDTAKDALVKALAGIEPRLTELKEQIAPLEQEERRLRQALAALDGTLSASRGRTASSSASRGSVSEADVLGVLAANPDGLAGSAVAEALSVSAATARDKLKKLEEDGKARHEGEKRGQKWFAV